MNEFERRCKLLEDLRVGFHLETEYRPEEPPRQPVALQLFHSVKLPFTPDEWMALCQADGEYYVGGCCGNMSVVQDEITHIFRFEAEHTDIRRLADIASTMANHDCGDDAMWSTTPDYVGAKFKRFVKARQALSSAVSMVAIPLEDADPWRLIAYVWHITKDFYKTEPPQRDPHLLNPNRSSAAEDAAYTLYQHLMGISFDRLLSDENDKQRDGNRFFQLSKILPALKILTEQIDQLAPPPLNGYAIVLREHPNDVVTNRRGLCIFRDQADAQGLIDMLKHIQNEHTMKREPGPTADSYTIRPVSITMEKGIEFKG